MVEARITDSDNSRGLADTVCSDFQPVFATWSPRPHSYGSMDESPAQAMVSHTRSLP